MNVILCVRIGDSGPYQQFDNPDDAIDYLNEQLVGQVEEWVSGAQAAMALAVDDGLTRGFTTCNHTGPWYVRMYWGDSASMFRAPLDENDRFYIEHNLEEHVIVPKPSPSGDCLWLRVGRCGEYEKMDDLDAAIEYLNELRVGRIIMWVPGGFETQNYHGQDYVSLYYGDHKKNHVTDIIQERAQRYVEHNLEENEL